jgi:hypothetical protein
MVCIRYALHHRFLSLFEELAVERLVQAAIVIEAILGSLVAYI